MSRTHLGAEPAYDAALPLADLIGADEKVPLVTGGYARYVNLDLAASAPALRPVADRVAEFLPSYASVHRGAGFPSVVSTAGYEAARRTIARFVGARADDVVQVVRNTTDALNLLATAVPGDVVHLDLEHHANYLPWCALRQGSSRVVTGGATVAATLAAVESELAATPAALLSVTAASNVTGEILPLAALSAIAHRYGARTAVDAAQLVPHRRLDIAALDVDYVAFSGHKLYAPFGAGVLVGRVDWLDAAPPYLAGGGAVSRVTRHSTDWASAPARHEGGTPNAVGAIALAAACDVLAGLSGGPLEAHEDVLRRRLHAGLAAIDEVRVLRLWGGEADAVGLATFVVDGYPAELVAQYLSAEHGVGVRDGRFCAHPLLDRIAGGRTAVRASLGLGSTTDDVDRLLAGLRLLVTEGPTWTYGPDHLPVPDPRPLPDWAA